MFEIKKIITLFIGAAVILSLIWTANTIEKTLVRGTIATKGFAERKITSDFAAWKGNLTVRQVTLKEAFDQLLLDQKITEEFFKEKGIQESEFNFSSIDILPLYKRDKHGNFTHTIEEYSLSCNFSVYSSQVTKIAQISEQSKQLIKEKVEITSYAPQYFYTKIDELKIDLLGQAAKDALARAQKLAAPTKSTIHALKSATQGVFQITPPYSTAVSDLGENDTSTIEKSIKAIVKIEYIAF